MDVHPGRVAGYVPVTDDPLADLVAAFPRDRLEAETVFLYRRVLSDVPSHLLADAIYDLICTQDRFPTLAQIRFAVAELTLALPSETDALGQVEARLRWRHQRHDGDDIGGAPALDPLVRAAIQHVGGINAFRDAGEPAVIRGQFNRYYRELRAARIRTLQVRGRHRIELEPPAADDALTA